MVEVLVSRKKLRRETMGLLRANVLITILVMTMTIVELMAFGGKVHANGHHASDTGKIRGSIEILRPRQGDLVEEGSLIVEWRVRRAEENVDETQQVVIMVNGLVVHVSPAENGLVSMQEVRAGVYLHVHAFLARYEEEEGITNVASASSVECKIISKERVKQDSQVQVEREPPYEYTPYVPANRSGEQPGREPVIIFTFHCNRPDLVLLQHRALSNFILDKFKMIVINDAQSEDTRSSIANASIQVGADHFLTPDYFDHSDPSYVVGKVVTWAVQEIALARYNDSVIFLLEGDLFPIAKFSPLHFIKGYNIAGTQQGRRHAKTGFLLRYLWVGFLVVDLRGLPNKHLLNMVPTVVGDVGGDTASSLHHFFDASPEIKVRRVLHTSHIHDESKNKDVLPKEALDKYQDSFRIEIYERSFLHYGSASNWKIGRSFEYFNSAEDFLPSKTSFVFWFVDSAINGSLKLDDFDFVFEHGTWENAIGSTLEHQRKSEL